MPTISPSDIDATWPDGVLVTSTFDAWRKKTNGFIEAYNTGSLVPDGSITPVKLSTGGPAWTSEGVLTVTDQLKSKSLVVGSTYGQFTVSEAGVVVAFNTITGTSLNTAGAVSANSLAIGTSNNKFTVSSTGTVVATSSITATSLNVGSGAVTAGAITAISLNATGAIVGASLSAGSGTISTTGTISGSVVTSTGVANANTLAVGSTNTQFTVSAAGAIIGTSLNAGSGTITTTGNAIAASPTLSTHLTTKGYVDSMFSYGTLSSVPGGSTAAFLEFTSVPSTVKRITIMLGGVSTNGTSNLTIVLGDSDGYETSGYISSASRNGSTGSSTTSFLITEYTNAADGYYGSIVLTRFLPGVNTWILSGSVNSINDARVHSSSGIKGLSGSLDKIKVTTFGGVNIFDSGSVNIMYEF